MICVIIPSSLLKLEARNQMGEVAGKSRSVQLVGLMLVNQHDDGAHHHRERTQQQQ
jgi:hypothetical protein